MKYIKLISPLFLILLASNGAIAQILPAEEVQVHLEVAENAADIDLDAVLADTEGAFLSAFPFEVKLLVQISNMDELANIHLKFGNTEGADDLANHIFTIDDVAGNSGNYSYTVENNTVILHLGIFSDLTTHFAEVRLEDLNGDISVATLYSSEGF